MRVLSGVRAACSRDCLTVSTPSSACHTYARAARQQQSMSEVAAHPAPPAPPPRPPPPTATTATAVHDTCKQLRRPAQLCRRAVSSTVVATTTTLTHHHQRQHVTAAGVAEQGERGDALPLHAVEVREGPQRAQRTAHNLSELRRAVVWQNWDLQCEPSAPAQTTCRLNVANGMLAKTSGVLGLQHSASARAPLTCPHHSCHNALTQCWLDIQPHWDYGRRTWSARK
jgi:hypothetical protein